MTSASWMRMPVSVRVDASSSGIGAVLSKRQGHSGKLHPCAYYSCKLTTAESNYDVGNRELLSIKAALEVWQHWLEGARHLFLVLTDHRNLEYLREAKRLNPRQAQWALFFSCFQFSVTYRPGSKNSKADALSRQHEPLSPPLIPASIYHSGSNSVKSPGEYSTGTYRRIPATVMPKLYVLTMLRPIVLQ
ncbi:hypothetical protein QTP86_000789 [Hemibagrus guttatus]|nr:hypothetical protein QTP86_000789 [Hemibagrus guttatus]